MNNRYHKSGIALGTGLCAFGVGLLLNASAVRGNAALDAQDKKVAARVEQIIKGIISSPKKNMKLVVTPTADADKGYFSQIVVEGKPVKIKKLELTEFSLRATNVRISVPGLAENKVRTIQTQTKLRAVVTEDDLTKMLAQGKHSAAMGLKVKYLKDPTHGDVLRVTGNWKWSWFSGPVTGIGKLRVTKDNQVFADIISLQLNGREVPAFVKNKFSDNINPVLDYTDVPFQPRFRSVKVEGSRAILSA
jgi:hypothetical protein